MDSLGLKDDALKYLRHFLATLLYVARFLHGSVSNHMMYNGIQDRVRYDLLCKAGMSLGSKDLQKNQKRTLSESRVSTLLWGWNRTGSNTRQGGGSEMKRVCIGALLAFVITLATSCINAWLTDSHDRYVDAMLLSILLWVVVHHVCFILK